jgi:hypothetical protein
MTTYNNLTKYPVQVTATFTYKTPPIEAILFVMQYMFHRVI